MTFEEAIELAVKENKTVSFYCQHSNEEIRKITKNLDLKGCHLMKRTPEDVVVYVQPSSIYEMIFG